jgi:hypothetical protein
LFLLKENCIGFWTKQLQMIWKLLKGYKTRNKIFEN